MPNKEKKVIIRNIAYRSAVAMIKECKFSDMRCEPLCMCNIAKPDHIPLCERFHLDLFEEVAAG